MGTLTEVVLLLWVLVYIPKFESASVFRRMIHDGGEKHEQIDRAHRVQDIFLNKLENKKPFAIFPFWNKATTTVLPSLITTTTTNVDPTTNSPFASSFNLDIQFPSSNINNNKKKRVLSRTRVPSITAVANNKGIADPASPSNKASYSNLIKRARQRRRRKPVVRPPPSRIRRTTTLSPPPFSKDGITPTIMTQLHTVSEMLVTRNVTSTRTVTESPLNYTNTIAFMLDDFTEFPSSPLPPHPLQVTTTVSFPTTTIATVTTTTTTTSKLPSGFFFQQHHRHPSAPLLSTGPSSPTFTHKEQQGFTEELEKEEDQITTTVSPIPEFYLEITTKLPDITTTFYPLHIQEQQREELRSPKKIRDSPVKIELLNPFEEHDKEVERVPREENTMSPSTVPEEGDAKIEMLKLKEGSAALESIESKDGNEDFQKIGDDSGEYPEIYQGQYHEVNPGQYHEVNPGQYYEKNPGQYHEINPGQYVHHSETEEGNPTTIQIHHRDEDKKVYNVQSKVDEFIIGEYGTISKSSGQTLQGVRYTAIGESVDSKLIYDTLIKFFNFQ
ncbi:uncharacterized protein [Lepeophtheirus salmonis]|uniref:uncharacterized protein n=1 Tax=Lepeophtheirus salmonis TaxID=72036 RepID=UPI001AEB0E54|nr:uncharacterized protein LOC121125154 [Lepeophtheirus salmonis]XP_040576223.1 uncharacterized protein LOC121125154 [Lepeophtheirus salmonis]